MFDTMNNFQILGKAVDIHNALHYKTKSPNKDTETQLSETLKDLRTGSFHRKNTNSE
jgi:hypothetical protein